MVAPTLGTSTRDPAVAKMFDDLSPRYDLVNHLITFGQATRWRRRLVSLLPGGGRVLDLGCGTGDVMIEVLRQGRATNVVGVDLTPGMLRRAGERLADGGVGERARLLRGDGETLPFRDACFEAVVSSFVMRNVGDRAAAYREIARVLKPGGRYVQLEMGRPRNRLARKGFLFYFQRLMPLFAGLVAGDRTPYKYLAEGLDRWPHQDDVSKEIKTEGFASVEMVEVAMGTAAIHAATK